MSLTMIRHATWNRDRLKALELIDELLEAIQVDFALEQRGTYAEHGIHVCQ